MLKSIVISTFSVDIILFLAYFEWLNATHLDTFGKYIYYLNMADILVFGVRHYSI